MSRLAARGLVNAIGKRAFDILHKQLHTSLLAACGSPRLIATCGRLYEEAYRYRRLMMATFTDTAARSPATSRLGPLYHAIGDIEAALGVR